MAFTNYYHKNQPRNYSESPSPESAISGNQNLDDEFNQRTGLRLKTAIVGGLAVNSGRKVFNSVVDSTGNSVLKKNISLIGTSIATAGATMAWGPVALLAPSITIAGNVIVQAIEEYGNQENDRYNQQLLGKRNQYYNKGGVYND